jgi:hypothetical protein
MKKPKIKTITKTINYCHKKCPFLIEGQMFCEKYNKYVGDGICLNECLRESFDGTKK